jgi:hypothetical protein
MYNPLGLPLMYNPLEPWNAWFAFSSQPAHAWAGMLRGIAQGCAKADAETDRMVIENVGAAEPAHKSNNKHRGANKAMAVAAQRDRRNRQKRVRYNRHRVRSKKISKRRPSGVRQRRIAGR